MKTDGMNTNRWESLKIPGERSEHGSRLHELQSESLPPLIVSSAILEAQCAVLPLRAKLKVSTTYFFQSFFTKKVGKSI